MRIYFLRNIVSCLFLVLLISCDNKCKVGNIEVSELLATVAMEKSIDYCGLLKIALTGDEESIKILSLLEFNDSVGYDHGAILVDLVLIVGEEKYLQAILTVSKKQKILIESYLEIGLIYSKSGVPDNTDLEKIFPEVYSFLKK